MARTLCVRSGHSSKWSRELRLAEGSTEPLSLLHTPDRHIDSAAAATSRFVGHATDSAEDCRSCELTVTVTAGPTPFNRTHVVSFLPRYVLVNDTATDLWVRQEGTDPEFVLPKGMTKSRLSAVHANEEDCPNHMVWHWTSARGKQTIQLKAG